MKRIATLQLTVCCLLFTACGTSVKKPATHTQVPSLDVAQEKVLRLRASIQDSKDGVSRLKARDELIDYKESLIK